MIIRDIGIGIAIAVGGAFLFWLLRLPYSSLKEQIISLKLHIVTVESRLADQEHRIADGATRDAVNEERFKSINLSIEEIKTGIVKLLAK